MQCYLKILAWQKETELLNQIIDSWILQEFQGNEKFYKYLMPFIKTKISPKRFEAIMAKATREFPKASLVDTVKQYTDYKQHYKKYTPKECIAEIEQLRGLPRYEKDQDLLVFLAICYQKTKNYQAALKILVECALIKDSLFIREQIGYCYYYLQDYEQASFYLKACLLEDPMNRTLCLLVEKLYLALNQPKQLYELCQEVLVRHPSAKHLYGYMKRITKWPKN